MGDMSATTETTSQPGRSASRKMAGSSIAGRDAAAWVTDFLNAAYYRRDADEREVDDLRFAFGVLTTYWYRTHPDAGCASPTCRPSTAPSAPSASARTSPRAARSAATRSSAAPRR